MIKIEAKIRLYKSDKGRKTPFQSEYRPLFEFVADVKTSGQILLIDQKEFYPGEEGVVVIWFLHRHLLGEGFNVGSRFTFSEGRDILGDGEVLAVVGRDD